jgi:stearoyl-CoA desaturase (delta-9 desaturase)
MKKDFWIMWLPLQLLGVLSLGYAIFCSPEYLWYSLGFYILLGFIGTGVAGHRYLTHKHFTCSKITGWILGYIATLAHPTNIGALVVTHVHHHRSADTDKDPHSPDKGFFVSFYGWMYLKETENLVAKTLIPIRHIQRDPVLRFFDQYQKDILLLTIVLLLIINWKIACIGFIGGWVLTQIRIGLATYLNHLNWIPGNYRNFETSDRSYNNVALSWLLFNSGFHNNHHANTNKLFENKYWWEIDPESCMCWVLSKI